MLNPALELEQEKLDALKVRQIQYRLRASVNSSCNAAKSWCVGLLHVYATLVSTHNFYRWSDSPCWHSQAELES